MKLGTLFVVATPIGNLEDMTFRAINILSSVDTILCEDTRVTKKILNKFDFDGKLISCNEFSEIKKISQVSNLLMKGLDVALVSDAGTPCISDPGFRLISYLRENHKEINVLSVPGASALTSAVSISGLPSDSLYFVGFLPKKKGRLKKIRGLSSINSTLVIYESPFRINKTIEDLYKSFGNRKLFIVREMTKLYEDIYYGDLKTFLEKENLIKLKGEFVIIISKTDYSA